MRTQISRLAPTPTRCLRKRLLKLEIHATCYETRERTQRTHRLHVHLPIGPIRDQEHPTHVDRVRCKYRRLKLTQNPQCLHAQMRPSKEEHERGARALREIRRNWQAQPIQECPELLLIGDLAIPHGFGIEAATRRAHDAVSALVQGCEQQGWQLGSDSLSGTIPMCCNDFSAEPTVEACAECSGPGTTECTSATCASGYSTFMVSGGYCCHDFADVPSVALIIPVVLLVLVYSNEPVVTLSSLEISSRTKSASNVETPT